MSEPQAFAIQLADGPWFAGNDTEGNPTWDETLERAQLFPCYNEARVILGRFQEIGLKVRLLWVAVNGQQDGA